jgi:hypothetical protein
MLVVILVCQALGGKDKPNRRCRSFQLILNARSGRQVNSLEQQKWELAAELGQVTRTNYYFTVDVEYI